MIRSMTAFAKQDLNESWGQATWELRTVNNRFLDVNFKMPDNLRALEMPCRELIKKYCARGKIDCHLRLQHSNADLVTLKLNHSMMKQLNNVLTEMSTSMGSSAAINPSSLLRFPGLITAEESGADSVKQAILASFEQALQKLCVMREREGESLVAVILEKLELMTVEVNEIKPLLDDIVSQHKNKLKERLQEIDAEFDESRLAQEMVYLAQKFDVVEEIDRLQIYIQAVKKALAGDENVVGRRLDFLIQELHREANTLGSKSVHERTTQASVQLKVLIEQVREQVQNLE